MKKTANLIYPFVKPEAKNRYGDALGSVRNGMHYVLEKFPALFYATTDEIKTQVGENALVKMIEAVLQHLEQGGSRDDTLLTGTVAKNALAGTPWAKHVVVLPPFALVTLEVMAIKLLPAATRPSVRRDDCVTVNVEAQGLELPFFEDMYAKSAHSASVILSRFWGWYDTTLAAAGEVGTAPMREMMKRAMGDCLLPDGPLAGDQLRRLLAMRTILPVQTADSAPWEEVRDLYNAAPAFTRACLEIGSFDTRDKRAKQVMVSTLLLQSTAEFYEGLFKTKAAGLTFVGETFRDLFEEVLSDGFIERTFTAAELTRLRALLEDHPLPRGGEVGLHLMHLLKARIDAADDGEKVRATDEELLTKVLRLPLFHRVVLVIAMAALGEIRH